jgi:predicted glutamine amidotransferase
MDSLRLAGRHATQEERIEAVSDAVDTIITRELEVPHPLGRSSAKLNVLFSDGELLIAYNSGFRPMSRAHHTFDDGTTIGMVASEPLDDEFEWEVMDIGEFIVLDQGTIIDHRCINGCPPELGGIPARSS